LKSFEENPQLSDIAQKFDRLIRLQALQIIEKKETQKEQIALLSDVGFQPVEIAGILGTSRNTVNVALHGIRKEREGKEKKGTTAENAEEQSLDRAVGESDSRSSPMRTNSTQP
jgi:DNA-directed RNA polymerase specialized sigma24 family protein